MNASFADRDALGDLLQTTKALAAAYDLAAKESANAGVREQCMTHWGQMQGLHGRLFHEMHKRGWYQTRTAAQQAIRTTLDRWEKQEHKQPLLSGDGRRGS